MRLRYWSGRRPAVDEFVPRDDRFAGQSDTRPAEARLLHQRGGCKHQLYRFAIDTSVMGVCSAADENERSPRQRQTAGRAREGGTLARGDKRGCPPLVGSAEIEREGCVDGGCYFVLTGLDRHRLGCHRP